MTTTANPSPRPARSEVLTVANLSPLLMSALSQAFVVHHRTHESDPAGFALAAPRLQAA